MSEHLNPEPDSADLWGLPERDQSVGRDLLEKIASDYLDSLRVGQAVTIDQIIARHPSLEAELREFLPLVAAMEDWKSQQELRSLNRPLPEKVDVTQLGDCRIVREIARGGMGVVFEAEQGAIARRVAVKLLPRRIPKDSRWAIQFLREARTAASLQHANIVPVFSFGVQDERYYYVMQLIEGVGLDRLIDRWKSSAGLVSVEDLIGEFHPRIVGDAIDQKRSRKLLRHGSWSQLAKMAAQIAGALRHAHRQGILHRDIKPGNLLIDVTGKIWITDFGLAMPRQLLEEETGAFGGTLRYMAPEQFQGQGDERSDLYAFGVTLYELCTLRPAIPGRTKNEVLSQIQSATIRPPREIVPEIPERLQRIIMKAIARNPDQRYQSASHLHTDLISFLNSDSDRKSHGFWRMLRRWF